MKEKHLLIALIACISILSVSLICNAGEQDFTLVNDTGFSIYSLYLSPASDDEWGDDILGVDVLENGQRAEIKFSRKETKCKWDIQVIGAEDSAYYWDNIDLCKYSTITLHYKKGKAWATFQ